MILLGLILLQLLLNLAVVDNKKLFMNTSLEHHRESDSSEECSCNKQEFKKLIRVESQMLQVTTAGFSALNNVLTLLPSILACQSFNSPCLNGGVCSYNPTNKVTCTCSFGFNGDLCQNSPFGSNIVTTIGLANGLNKLLSPACTFVTSFQSLLYQATRDGFSASQFHSKCNNQGPTLTLIQTTLGYIFGGYSFADWEDSGGCVVDNTAFLISLNNYVNIPQKLMVNQGHCSIYNSNSDGPYFGPIALNATALASASPSSGDDIFIASMSNTDEISHSQPGGAYGNGYDPFLLAGQTNFKVAEIEVYALKSSSTC